MDPVPQTGALSLAIFLGLRSATTVARPPHPSCTLAADPAVALPLRPGPRARSGDGVQSPHPDACGARHWGGAHLPPYAWQPWPPVSPVL